MPVLKHIYEPRGGCKEVMQSREAEVLISGPAGTGKSRACLEKVHMMCLMTPGTRALILRKVQRSLGSSALVTWKRFVAAEALATTEVVYYGGSSAEPPQYRYRNGSTVTLGGLDNATRVMSTEYDIIYIQEATEITVDDLEMVKTRTRNWRTSFQQVIMDCNPAGAKHWLRQRCRDGKALLIESRHEDNPMLFEECSPDAVGAKAYEASSTGFICLTERGGKYIAVLDALTGVRYKRLRLGLWVSAEGIVYEVFDPAKHVVSTMPDGWETWERFWAIDFGFRKPFVLQCYAESPDGALYLYREIYMTERTVSEHVTTIMDIVAPETVVREGYYDHINRREIPPLTKRVWVEPEPWAVICDHDAQSRRTFERETGLGTVAAVKDVATGIDLHTVRIKEGQWFVLSDCVVEVDEALRNAQMPTSTEEEYGSYAWKVDTGGKILDEPVKEYDHGMDAARYTTMYRDFRGLPRISELPIPA